MGAKVILQIRSGDLPQTTSDPDVGDALVSFRLPTLIGPHSLRSPVEAAGEARHFRVYERPGVVAFQGTVGDYARSGDLFMDTRYLYVGNEVTLEWKFRKGSS